MAARGGVNYYGVWVNLQPGYVKFGYPARVGGYWWLAMADWTTGSDGNRYCFDDYWYHNGFQWVEWGYWGTFYRC